MMYKKSQKVARDGKHSGGNSSCGSPDRLEGSIDSLEQIRERFRVYDKEPWRSHNLRSHV